MTKNQKNEHINQAMAVYAVVVERGVIIGKSLTPRKATKRHFNKNPPERYYGHKEVIVWFESEAEAGRVLSDCLTLIGRMDVKRTGDNRSPLVDVPIKSAKMFIEQAYVRANVQPVREYDVFRKRGFRKRRELADLSQYKGIE